jgi:hypothetical protein
VNQNGDCQCSEKESSEGNNNIHGGVIAENQVNESATARVTTQAEDRDATGGTRLDREQTTTTTLSLDNVTKGATRGHTGPTVKWHWTGRQCTNWRGAENLHLAPQA